MTKLYTTFYRELWLFYGYEYKRVNWGHYNNNILIIRSPSSKILSCIFLRYYYHFVFVFGFLLQKNQVYSIAKIAVF